jgi:DNA-binding Lrp family transcriptional regulator
MESYADLDEKDIVILEALQHDSRITNVELARRVELSPPAVHARIRRLEDSGMICSYATIVNREALGYEMTCFIEVNMQLHNSDTIADFHMQVVKMPEVLECHQLTGDTDYLLKVVIRSKRDLERFLVEKLMPIEGVARVKTSMSLSEIKSTTVIPLPSQDERQERADRRVLR